jgi:hypothetical protein
MGTSGIATRSSDGTSTTSDPNDLRHLLDALSVDASVVCV